MTTALAAQRCWNHSSRQAVVRCPECHRYFCRECVTEHRGRMMCAGCVAAAIRPTMAGSRSGNARWLIFGTGGLMIAWVIFYYLGMMLARVPSDFFE